LGNTTSLTRLGAGLDKTTLKSGNMDLIMKKLATTFRGDAATAANSFQGKMDRLNVAVTEAKVNIGQGLVTALTELGGSNGFEGALKGILDFSKGISDAIIGTERLIKIVGFFVYNTKGTNPITQMNEFNKANAKADMLQRQVYGGAAATKYQGEVALALSKSKLKVDQASAKTMQDAKKSTVDKLALERSALSLKLAGSTVDMQNIEIQAALQRGQTDQVNNVLLLQRALITGNADEANVLAQKVLTANGLVMDVNGNITALAGAKDPFKDWPTAAQSAIDQLKKVNDYLATIKDKTITITVNTVTTSSGGSSSAAAVGVGNGKPFGPAYPLDPTTGFPVITVPVVPNIPAGGQGLGASGGFSSVVAAAMGQIDLNPTGATSLGEYNREKYGNASNSPIVINISAPPSTTVTTTQDASTNGTPVTVNRNNPFGMYSV